MGYHLQLTIGIYCLTLTKYLEQLSEITYFKIIYRILFHMLNVFVIQIIDIFSHRRLIEQTLNCMNE